MEHVKIAMLRAAEALRKIAAENEALKSDSKTFKECINIAFDMASNGQIEDSKEAIMAKAEELMNKKEEIPVVKQAMEMSNNYMSIGKIVEKTASLDSDDMSPNELRLLERLQDIL